MYALFLQQVDIAETLIFHYNVPISKIAILTPYSAQKAAIGDEVRHERRRGLQKRIKERGEICIKTITESQGKERHLVLPYVL